MSSGKKISSLQGYLINMIKIFHNFFLFPLSVCAFIFHSDDKTNGTFTSPNFPGLYPRDTECHYFFQGKPKERVHITFTKFDVDGIPP